MFCYCQYLLLVHKICSGCVQQSRLCTLAKNLSLLPSTFVSTASVASTSCSCLLLKVLMYSLNLMISLISVPSLASISHCYQINFLKFFFFFIRSFRITAELSRKHSIPVSSLPQACTAFPSISAPHSGSLVTVSAPPLTQDRPKSMVYTGGSPLALCIL